MHFGYADDIAVGFEHEADARRFWDAMRTRLEEFSLALHPDKTRLLEFGRNAAGRRKRHGLGRPETFTFLDFIFICGRSRRGAFQLQRKTRGDRMRAKLRQIKEELRRRMHDSNAGAMASAGGARILRVSRRAYQLAGYQRILPPRHQPLAAHAPAAQPEGRRDVGVNGADRQCVAPATSCSSSVAKRAVCRQTPEVGARCPNWARRDLCRGGSAMGIPTAIRGWRHRAYQEPAGTRTDGAAEETISSFSGRARDG